MVGRQCLKSYLLAWYCSEDRELDIILVLNIFGIFRDTLEKRQKVLGWKDYMDWMPHFITTEYLVNMTSKHSWSGIH